MSTMNHSEELDILKHQRSLFADGPLNFKNLFLGTIPTYKDNRQGTNEIYFKYGQEQKAKNRMTPSVFYLYRKPVQIQNTVNRLDYMYIARIYAHIYHLFNQKRKQYQLLQYSKDTEIDQQDILKDRENYKEKGNLYQVINFMRGICYFRQKQTQKMKKLYMQNNKNGFFDEKIMKQQEKSRMLNKMKDILGNNQCTKLKVFMNKMNDIFNDIVDTQKVTGVILLQPNLQQITMKEKPKIKLQNSQKYVQGEINEVFLKIDPIALSIYNNIFVQVDLQFKRRKSQNYQQPSQVFKYTKMTSSLMPKIAYIDFSGSQSLFTSDLFRSLNNFLMYVSFPKPSQSLNIINAKSQGQTIRNITKQCEQQLFYDNYSFQHPEILKLKRDIENLQQQIKQQQKLQQAIHKLLTENKSLIQQNDVKKRTINQFKRQLQEYSFDNNRNIYTFPLKCNQQSDHVSSLYQSNIVYYLIKNIVLRRLNQFAPTLIVINYNGNIHIENHHFLDIMKQFSVQALNKIVFYPGMNECFTNIPEAGIKDDKYQEYFKKAHSYLNLKENDDLLQKIDIFHTVAAGKSSLEKVQNPYHTVQRFRNIQSQQYISQVLKVVGPSNDALSILSTGSKQMQLVKKILVQTSYYNKYLDYFTNIKLTSYPEQYRSQNFYFSQILKNMQSILFYEQAPKKYFQIVEYLNIKYNNQQLTKMFQIFKLDCIVKQFSKKQRPVSYLKIQFKDETRNLYLVKFYTTIGDTQVPINLTEQSQILYSNQCNNDTCLVYVMNHLLLNTKYKNYYGIVKKNTTATPNNILKIQNIQLFQIQLPITLSQSHILYTNWNYHQTQNHIFLLFPIEYNFIETNLKQLAKISYHQKQSLNYNIYYANIDNPKQFYQFQYDTQKMKNKNYLPRFKCNIVSYEKQNELEMYIFGGQTLSSERYAKNIHHLVKIKAHFKQNKIKGEKTDLGVIDQSYLPTLSEMEIIKKGKKTFLIGGYGKQFQHAFFTTSQIFYQIDFQDLKLEGREGKQVKIMQQRIIKHFCQEYKINIKAPLRLRNNNFMFYISKKQSHYYEISQQPIQCLASQGVIIKNQKHFIIQKGKPNLYSLQDYQFVDSSYQRYSEQYQNFLDKIKPPLKEISMTLIQNRNTHKYITFRSNTHPNDILTYDYMFVPSKDLLKMRKQKKEKIRFEHKDILKNVQFLTSDQKRMVILFSHPRITLGHTVLAECYLTEENVEASTNYIYFKQIGLIQKQQKSQPDYMPIAGLNILNNNDLIITKHKLNKSKIILIPQTFKKISSFSSHKIISQISRPYPFQLLTHTINNNVIFIIYHLLSETTIQLQFLLCHSSHNNLFSPPSTIMKQLKTINQTINFKLSSSFYLSISYAQIFQQLFSTSTDIEFSFDVWINKQKKIDEQIKLSVEIPDKLHDNF